MLLVTPIIEELLTSLLSYFITFAANDCEYNGFFTEIYMTVVYPILLKV